MARTQSGGWTRARRFAHAKSALLASVQMHRMGVAASSAVACAHLALELQARGQGLHGGRPQRREAHAQHAQQAVSQRRHLRLDTTCVCVYVCIYLCVGCEFERVPCAHICVYTQACASGTAARV